MAYQCIGIKVWLYNSLALQKRCVLSRKDKRAEEKSEDSSHRSLPGYRDNYGATRHFCTQQLFLLAKILQGVGGKWSLQSWNLQAGESWKAYCYV